MDVPPSGLQTIVLAALLHDIGKFAQRAQVPLALRSRSFGRDDYGEHGAHALHSVQFIEDELAPRWQACRSPVLYHHKPAEPLAAIVAAADHFSAGEREGEALASDATLQPLRNVLSSVALEWKEPLAAPSYFALSRLNPSAPESFFPSVTEPPATAQRGAYARLWQEFVAGHRRLSQATFDGYLAGLYSLLQAYTWCIPSAAYRSVPDISLFDHSRTSAAIAAALYSYLSDQGRMADFRKTEALEAEPCFRLAVGDLSGIQSYLYDIANTGVGGVARRLRARSLYLQLIVEVAAQQLLAETGLTFINALMLSGGRFYLLLPNTEAARQAVAVIQERADRWLLKRFGGELALNLASLELSGADLRAGEGKSGFGSLLERAGHELTQRKHNRLREALQGEGRWREEAFLLESFRGESACESCHKQPRAPGADFCDGCRTDFEVGRRLPQAACLAFYAEERPHSVPVLGHSVEVLSYRQAPAGTPYLALALDGAGPEGAGPWPTLARPICNYVPTWSREDLAARPPVREEDIQAGDPVTFEDLAERASGRKLLGFLKADVDRLGETFVFGLKGGLTASAKDRRDRDTSSRLAQMSRLLDLFFSGWLPALLRSRFGDCYSVYAGGDDLLLVGPWDQIVELATALVEDFSRLTANPQLHLSAGIFLAKPGYPIARAARGADELLDQAKEAGRNRLSLLGHTLTWDRWAKIREQWLRLKPEAEEAASAFLYHLLSYARMWRQYLEWEKDHRKGSVLGLRFQPLLAYDISRNLDRRQMPGLYAFAESLTAIRPADDGQKLWLDNLGLLAQLWILGKGGKAKAEGE